MPKLVLDDIANLYGNTVAAETAINANFAKIEAAVENTVSRNGSGPNNMSANLDMNSFRVTNLADGVNPSDAVTLRQLQNNGAPQIALDTLSDVGISNPLVGDRLVYNGSEWRNQSASEGGGIAVLNDLQDVVIGSPQNQHALVYDNGQWINSALPSGVTDHGALSGLTDDDHPQYLTQTRAGTFYPSINTTVSGVNSIIGGGNLSVNRELQLVNDASTPGVSRYYGTNSIGTKGWFSLPSPTTDHGTLTGLGDDDHPQYLNTTRANALYSGISHTHTNYTDRTAATETITGQWTFNLTPKVANAGPVLYHGSSSMASGRVTVSSSPPTGGENGDIWFVVA